MSGRGCSSFTEFCVALFAEHLGRPSFTLGEREISENPATGNKALKSKTLAISTLFGHFSHSFYFASTRSKGDSHAAPQQGRRFGRRFTKTQL
jgi:hypothetical protein